jgi:hypothetical protein
VSSSTIQCLTCHEPLADKRSTPAGTIKVRPGVFARAITVQGVEVVCPACGRVRVVTVPERRAA